MRVADYIADFLISKGINTVFMLSGGGMMHLMDGLAQNKNLKVVCHHHEQAAGMAAEGYSRTSGHVAACFGTSGPGGTNLVTSIAGSWGDSTPVLYFTGQSKLSQTIQNSGIPGLRQFGTFEVDISEVVKPITKKSYFVSDPKKVPEILQEAYDIATSGRPGPVLLDFPVDIQGANSDFQAPGTFALNSTEVFPNAAEIVARWRAAKRPLVWIGHGVRVADQVEQAAKLLQLSGTAAVTTMLAKDALPYESEYFIGHPGVKGDRVGNWAVQSADFILFIGTSLHVLNTGYEMDKFAPKAYKVQIDVDPAHFARQTVGVQLQVRVTVKTAISELFRAWATAPASNTVASSWRTRLLELKTKYSVQNEKHQSEKGRINLFHVLEEINKAIPAQSVVVTDAGSAFYVVGQALRTKPGQRVISSGSLGCMGWGLPAAVGSSFARPESPVICITGDGSLQTNLHELGVLSGNKRNVKLIVLNNQGYLSIKNTQDNYFQGRHLGVDRDSGVFMPNLRTICKAYGLDYLYANSRTKLAKALDDCLQTEGPLLIDVQCNQNQPIIPTVSSYKRDDGTMESRPLEDMAPFLSPKMLKGILKSLQ